MKIGFLKASEDQFSVDVMNKLKDFHLEMLSYSEVKLPLEPELKVVVDRFSYGDEFLTEIMKSISMAGVYVINNPFAASAANKIVDATLCDRLGIPRPKTYVLPEIRNDTDNEGSVAEPDLDKVIKSIDLPCILKPYGGFGWEHVYVVNSISDLKNLYNALKADHVMLAQEKIDYHHYYRAFCIGKNEVLLMKHIPRPFVRSEFLKTDLKEITETKDDIIEWTKKLNAALDFDFNTVEWAIDINGKPFIIDAFNEVPEVNRAIPESYYNWIVEKFAELIRQKANSGEKNRMIFPQE